MPLEDLGESVVIPPGTILRVSSGLDSNASFCRDGSDEPHNETDGTLGCWELCVRLHVGGRGRFNFHVG